MTEPKTKQQLQDELVRLRKRVAELETREVGGEEPGAGHLECEASYRALFNEVDYPVTRLDRDGTILQVNEAGAGVLGMTPDEMNGRSIYDLVPEARHLFSERFRYAFETGKTKRHQIKIDSTTGPHWLTSYYVPVKDAGGKIICLLVCSQDITDLKKAQVQHELLSSIVKQSTEGLALADLDGNLQFINDAFARMHGFEGDELLGRNLSIFHTEEQMPAVRAIAQQLMATGEFAGEVWHVHRDGKVFPTLMINSLLRDDAGEPIGLIGTVRDISEQKLAETELSESRERYRLLVNNTGCPIMLFDANGVLLLMNDIGARNLGGTPADFVGKSVHDIVSENGDLYMERMRTIVSSGEGGEFEDALTTPSGVRWFWSNIQPARDTEGTIYGVQIVSRDITELKESENALRDLTEELKAERSELHEKNIALKQVLEHMESHRQEWVRQMYRQLDETISPFLGQLAKIAGPTQAHEVEALKDTLRDILAKDADRFKIDWDRLTSREVEICQKVAKGMSSKQIAEKMSLSQLTISKHREKIRKKLGLTGKPVDLSAYLRRHLK